MKEKFTCCICGKTFSGYGNNPYGAMWLDYITHEPVEGHFKDGDRCCDDCDKAFVIPGRIYKLSKERKINI